MCKAIFRPKNEKSGLREPKISECGPGAQAMNPSARAFPVWRCLCLTHQSARWHLPRTGWKPRSNAQGWTGVGTVFNSKMDLFPKQLTVVSHETAIYIQGLWSLPGSPKRVFARFLAGPGTSFRVIFAEVPAPKLQLLHGQFQNIGLFQLGSATGPNQEPFKGV